jgi:hypothetical protein
MLGTVAIIVQEQHNYQSSVSIILDPFGHSFELYLLLVELATSTGARKNAYGRKKEVAFLNLMSLECLSTYTFILTTIPKIPLLYLRE